MLKVNVGLSRKVSRDYNSTGFSINLEGEVCAPLDDPEQLIEKVQELYDLAEESLNQQVSRHESDSAIASRDAEPASRPGHDRSRRSNGNGRSSQPQAGNGQTRHGNGGNSPPATNKQVQYLLNLGKRLGLTTPQLEQRVADIVGRKVGLYELTKDEAGSVLDQLTTEANTNTSPRR